MVWLIRWVACLPSLKPLLNLAMHGTVNPSSAQTPEGPTLVTIGGTENKANGAKGASKWSRQPRLTHTNYGTSQSQVTAARGAKSQSSDAEHPFAQLTDGDSYDENSQDGVALKEIKDKKGREQCEEHGIMVRKDVRVELARQERV